MSPFAQRPRTNKSRALEIVIAAALWSVNLPRMATRLRSMSFPLAASAVMLFLIVPAEMWRAGSGWLGETA